jgi:acetyltransferase-like isoleucine patch superfamily enzyme
MYYYLSFILKEWRLAKFISLYRKLNQHNHTIPGNIFPHNRVQVGVYTYGTITAFGFDSPRASIKVGNYCSIAGGVKFLAGGEHPKNMLTTFPVIRHIYGESADESKSSKGPIIIEDDVWVGENCVILSGTRIRQGCIVGAGSIVRKDIPPYAIYAENRIIRYRFPNSIVEKLLSIDFSSISLEAWKEYRTYCSDPVIDVNVEQILKIFHK